MKIANVRPGSLAALQNGSGAGESEGGSRVRVLYPGLLAAATVALASTWLSQHYGAPVMLFALLFGMAFHFLQEEGSCIAGIEFASRNVLRVGVALLGARITASQIGGLGAAPIVTVAVAVSTTIAFGIVASRWLLLSRTFGLLSGGAVAICGASAALAIASVLPPDKERERDTILTVVVVTALSTVAMILYPILTSALGLYGVRAGIFLGGTIHDVAQVVGAGYMISAKTGDTATYVKLLRVAMLLPVVIAISSSISRRAPGATHRRLPKIPLFLLGFVALVALNSLHVLPPLLVSGATETSRWCLAMAIAALGMKTSFKDLFAVGWRPVALMIAETAWVAALVLASVEWWR
jgi:uncharacterized integral membrane protein (TIGR00698 family)